MSWAIGAAGFTDPHPPLTTLLALGMASLKKGAQDRAGNVQSPGGPSVDTAIKGILLPILGVRIDLSHLRGWRVADRYARLGGEIGAGHLLPLTTDGEPAGRETGVLLE